MDQPSENQIQNGRNTNRSPSRISSKQKHNTSTIYTLTTGNKFGKELYVCYIDLRKAFDSVWRRKGLWKVLIHYGYPEKIIRILENMYKDTFNTVRVNGKISDWYSTIVGVLQGCVLPPLLFIILLEAVISS